MTDELELIRLSDKPSNLNAPGTKMSNLYYSDMNSMVESVESRFMWRYNQSLSTTLFGGTAQVSIENGSFLSTTALYLDLQNIPANVYASRGWGYSSIRQILFNFGSSNISSISYSGDSLWQILSSQCHTAEKRNELLRLGGDTILGATARSTAVVLLPLPWSAASGNKIPFDTNLLNQPINIQVQFKDSYSIFGGIGTYPTSFSSAKIIARQGDLSDKSVSVKLKLINQPGTFIGYPYTYPQTQTSTRFAGLGPAQDTSVQIQSFINSDLLAINFYIVKKRYVDVSPNKDTPNPLVCDEISDLVVELNGQQLYRLDGFMHKLMDMDQLDGAGYYSQVVIGAGNAGVVPISSKDCYVVTLDWSRVKAYVFHENYQNVPRIPQQPIVLRFKTEAIEDYYLYATYFYNALNSVSAGTSNISY
jgi:hypothetical protein